MTMTSLAPRQEWDDEDAEEIADGDEFDIEDLTARLPDPWGDAAVTPPEPMYEAIDDYAA